MQDFRNQETNFTIISVVSHLHIERVLATRHDANQSRSCVRYFFASHPTTRRAQNIPLYGFDSAGLAFPLFFTVAITASRVEKPTDCKQKQIPLVEYRTAGIHSPRYDVRYFRHSHRKHSTQTGNVSTSSGTKRTRVYGRQFIQPVLFVPMCAVLRHAVET